MEYQKAVNLMYQILYECSCQHNLSDFCGTIVREFARIIDYDQATVLFFDASGKIESSLLYGVEKREWNRFVECEKDGFLGISFPLGKPLVSLQNQHVVIRDWTDPKVQKKYQDFYNYHVSKQRLCYCLGFYLHDKNNCIRCIFSFDKTNHFPYSEDGIKAIDSLIPLLQNKFIDLLQPQEVYFDESNLIVKDVHMTKKEQEIIDLLCDGCSAAQIAERLRIAVSTVYKHIENIYKKLSINNRQELFSLYRKKRI